MTSAELFRKIKEKRNWREAQSPDKKLSAEWDLYEEGKEVYVLIQETNGAQDWIQNFSFTKRKYGELSFHHGFYQLYDLFRDDLIKELAEKVDKEIIVSGWSQGAGVAEIAAQDIYFHLGKKVKLVSFGAPMAIYGKKTRDACREACLSAYEYCNGSDIVTYQPPFPNWYHINRVNVGDSFNLFKLFNPKKYHTNYDKDLERC